MEKDSENPKNRGPQKTYVVAGITITECQMRIISLNAAGLLRKEMTSILSVELSTVNTHFNRIYKLLNLARSNKLVTWALTNGFDDKGNCEGVYLFENIVGVPWPT